MQCIGRATINRRIRTANVWARSQGVKCEAYGTRTGVYYPCQMSLHHCSMSVGHFMEEVWAHCRAKFYRRNVSRQPQDWRRVCAILSSHSTWPHCWSGRRFYVKCSTMEFMYLFNISGLWRKNVMPSTWYQQHGRRDSSVGIVSRLGFDQRGIMVRSPAGVWTRRKFFPTRLGNSFLRVQTSFAAHSAH
jgi:hypothetical protein